MHCAGSCARVRRQGGRLAGEGRLLSPSNSLRPSLLQPGLCAASTLLRGCCRLSGLRLPLPPSLHTSLPALLAVSTETPASALPLTSPQSPCIGCSFQLECSSLHLCHSELKSALPRGLPRWPPSTIVSLCLLAAPSLCLHTSALFFLAA